MVEEVLKLELDILGKMGVWQVVDRPANTKFIGTRRVDGKKG